MKFVTDYPTYGIDISNQVPEGAFSHDIKPESESLHIGKMDFYKKGSDAYIALCASFYTGVNYSIELKADIPRLPVLQILIAFTADSQFYIAGIGNITLKRGQFTIIYNLRPQLTINLKKDTELTISHLYCPAELLHLYVGHYPIERKLAMIKKSRPVILFRQPGWITIEIVSVVMTLCNCPIASTEREFYLNTEFNKLLLCLLKQKFIENSGQLEKAELEVVLKARHIAETYVHNKLTVPKIAHDLNTNTNQLKRDFRKIVKVNLQEYIRHCKIKYAVLLITQTSLDIQGISNIVGYAHYDIFLRDFKILTSSMPQQLRATNPAMLSVNIPLRRILNLDKY